MLYYKLYIDICVIGSKVRLSLISAYMIYELKD